MIESLHISNYALIDTVDIEFHKGFNIITGETGAGKSIMLGALSLLLGGRADSKAVRNPDKKSIIEASFSVTYYPQLKQYCIANDIEWDDCHCILRREIAPTGRSRAFVNDSPVSLSQLQNIAVNLVDIHSQHQNLLLASAEYQLQIIDSLANNEDILQQYAIQYASYRKALKNYHETRHAIEQSRDDEDFLRFQLEQLNDAALEEGEQEDLEQERSLLANMSDVKENMCTALNALQDGNTNIIDLLSEATDSINNLSEAIEDAESLSERLEASRIEIQDIADTLSEYNRNLSTDPTDLERIEERLNKLYALQRKHKVDRVDKLIAIRDSLRHKLSMLDNGADTIAELETEAKNARAIALATARTISARRTKEAALFASELKERAYPLGMKNLCCEIAISRTSDLTETGIDKVDFLFAFNKNQPLLPVGNTASGGEISRLMLSIKTIIASKMQLPSIIFDEIDTGVSGDVANRMGEMMQSIAQNIQVIAITHLPQVAAKGSSHFKVFKQDDEIATHTHITELSHEQRIDELALMLSGSNIDEAARANAISLLTNNSNSLNN